jgi:hypothetical protein
MALNLEAEKAKNDMTEFVQYVNYIKLFDRLIRLYIV